MRQKRLKILGLIVVDYGLRTIDYGLRTIDYGLRTIDYGLRTNSPDYISNDDDDDDARSYVGCAIVIIRL